MATELEKARASSQRNLIDLRQSVEHQASQLHVSWQRRDSEEHDARIREIQAELDQARRAQIAAEEDVAGFCARLADAEESAAMLLAEQEELQRHRVQFEEERRAARVQGKQHCQKIIRAERELQ